MVKHFFLFPSSAIVALCLLLSACVEPKSEGEIYCSKAPPRTAAIFLDDAELEAAPFCRFNNDGEIHAFLAVVPQSPPVVEILFRLDFSHSVPDALVHDGKVFDGPRAWGDPDTNAYVFSAAREGALRDLVYLFAKADATFDIQAFAKRLRICAIDDPKKCARLEVRE